MNLYIVPHPPIILKEIGKGKEDKAAQTIRGMQRIAREIKATAPKTIAIITPHGNVFSDTLCVHTEAHLSGDFTKFNHPDITYQFENNTKKANDICTKLVGHNISCLALNTSTAKQYNMTLNLDHGVLVPLYFITQEYTDFKLVHISIGFLSNVEMYEAGQIIAEVLGEDAVLIASGDLSHKLRKDGPYRYDDMGAVYDKHVVDAITEKRYIDILDVDKTIADRAGQCGQKPLEMLIGALEGYDSQSTLYSYEGPYGVGYMTAGITRTSKSEHSVLHDYLERKTKGIPAKTAEEDEYVSLARQTIHSYIKHGIEIDVPKGLSNALYHEQNGVFVSIKKEGQLRGCIGTINPTKENIAQEIIGNAISAATRDPRFNAITSDELSDLTISVDILFPPEDIQSNSQLDVKQYGVIVHKGFRRGLLLPNLDGVDTVDYQVAISLQKAGIKESENYAMQRFKVTRHT